MKHTVRVTGVPDWVDASRLLGGADWTGSDDGLTAVLNTEEAADVSARLRNVGLGGALLTVSCRPPLKRTAVRTGRTRDARARRDTTPGFLRRGVRVDEEGRYSLTPEALAVWMAQQAQERHVTDWGCGVGGNAIAFARQGCTVRAVERDAERRRCLLHNAALYGVLERIEASSSLPGDATGDLLFVDPPWGTDWDRTRTTPDDFPLLRAANELLRAGRFKTLWAKLPPSFDPASLQGCVPTAVFGRAEGDHHRVKFIWARLDA